VIIFAFTGVFYGLTNHKDALGTGNVINMEIGLGLAFMGNIVAIILWKLELLIEKEAGGL
jgi:hypothetical protein